MAKSLAYPSGEEGDNFLGFLAAFPRVEEGGLGVGTLWQRQRHILMVSAKVLL